MLLLLLVLLPGLIIIAVIKYHNQPRPQHQVPCIWQHPNAIPGQWDRVYVVWSEGYFPRKYKSAYFSENKDYMMNPGVHMTTQQVDAQIQDHIHAGWQPLNVQQWKHSYGLQSVV